MVATIARRLSPVNLKRAVPRIQIQLPCAARAPRWMKRGAGQYSSYKGGKNTARPLALSEWARTVATYGGRKYHKVWRERNGIGHHSRVPIDTSPQLNYPCPHDHQSARPARQ